MNKNLKQLYYRRKRNKIVIEGVSKDLRIPIATLPHPQILLTALIENSSFLSQEKKQKIAEKLLRLDHAPKKQIIHASKVPLIDITRTTKKDEESTMKGGDDGQKRIID